MAPANCIKLFYPQITQIAQIKKNIYGLKNNLCELCNLRKYCDFRSGLKKSIDEPGGIEFLQIFDFFPDADIF